MIQQQLNEVAALKNKYMDCILLVRYEDSYLAILEDALKVAEILQVETSLKDPTYIIHTWVTADRLNSDGLQKLVRAGNRVATADPESMQEKPKPKKAKQQVQVYLQEPVPKIIDQLLMADAYYLSHKYFTQAGWYNLVGETNKCYIIERDGHKISLFKRRFKQPKTA